MSTPPSGVAPTLNLLFKIAIAGAVALLAFEYFESTRFGGDSLHHTGIGEKLGAVSLQPLTGDPPPIDSKDLSGRVTLLNFWGPWCGPCKRELPHLVELNRRLSTRPDFLMVAVACGDQDEDLDSIRRQTASYLDAVKLPVQTYGDRGSVTREMLEKTCGMRGYPFTLLLDRDGVIRGVWEGYLSGTEAEMEKSILELLGPARPAGG